MELDKLDKAFLDDFRRRRIVFWERIVPLGTHSDFATFYQNASYEELISGVTAEHGLIPDSRHAFKQFRENRKRRVSV